MIKRFDWASDDRASVTGRIVEQLEQGLAVILPTGTSYALVAPAQSAQATDRFTPFARELWIPAIAVGDFDSLLRHFLVKGRRLVERALPGPLTLQFPVPKNDPDFPAMGNIFSRDGFVSMEMPPHEAFLDMLDLIRIPLGFAHAPYELSTAALASSYFSAAASAIVDAGPPSFSKPTTVVRIEGDVVQLIREGVVSESRLKRLMSEIITFVCTGNSCRSPMAEAIFRAMLSEALGCRAEELAEKGFIIQSAGTSALDGGAAAPEAREIVREYGATLEDHVSQSLTPEIMEYSDRIIAMTRDHRAAALDLWPEGGNRVITLAGRSDISDPIGLGIDRYRRCAAEIKTHLEPLLESVMAGKEPI